MKERDSILQYFQNKQLGNLLFSEEHLIDNVKNLWREAKLNNYQYLMQLNKLSGRTFNDLMQYPVYPHVICSFNQEILDLSLRENYRYVNRT